MDYKKIIKSRDMRKRILYWLNWIPDWIMIPMQYKIHTGLTLHLRNPKRFTEKLQLYKLKYRNPDMLRCTDKYEVRSYVKEKGMGDYLIPLIGVYNKAEETDFGALPRQFVAKTTDGGGGNSVFICKDKEKIKEEEFFARMKKWMEEPKGLHAGREWAYENHFPRRIVIEELIGNEKMKDLPDYKFYCFDGKPMYCQLIQDRATKETIDFYDMEWNHMPFYGLNPLHGPAAKPQGFEQMTEIAANLSKGYHFVRVDLYNVEGTTFFGELTFYPASGYGHFTPDEWEERLGELLNIPCDQLMEGGKYLIVNGVIHELYRGDDLVDYKFFCFNGKVHYVYGICDRKVGVSAQFGIYDREFNKLDVDRCDERHQEVALPKPQKYERMVEVAERLSEGFPHVRVDLYNVMGQIYFGELTFYDGSGYMQFSPDSFDFDMGEKFEINF